MGERYLVTGAQLGIFQAMGKANKPDEINKLVDKIIDKQFVGNTNRPIIEDVQNVQGCM